MPWASDRCAATVAFAAIVLRATSALGADDDPSHGRLEGDLAVVAGAGVAAVSGGARAAAEVRLRYLETAGVFATYEDGPLTGSGPEPIRVLATGLELRPLFLFRWLKGLETSRARIDLAVDSMGLELGAVFLQPSGGAFASIPGLEVGLGVELPILSRASGPWIGFHGGLRWSDQALGSGQIRGPNDRSAYLALTLAWHQMIVVHAVDAGDRAPY